MLTSAIPSVTHHPGATECVPGLDPVSKPGETEVGIVLKSLNNGQVGPTAVVLEGLRQIPVEQGDHRLHSRFEQGIDQLVVIGSPFF